VDVRSEKGEPLERIPEMWTATDKRMRWLRRWFAEGLDRV
jgi:hypothetical protein